CGDCLSRQKFFLGHYCLTQVGKGYMLDALPRLIRFKGAWMRATVMSPIAAVSWTAEIAVTAAPPRCIVENRPTAGVHPASSTIQPVFYGGYMKRLVCLATPALCLVALPTVNGQSVTGQINGTVVDASGGALVSSAVALTNDISKQVRSFTTDSSGSFAFTNLVPGTYTIKVSMAGFKVYEQR